MIRAIIPLLLIINIYLKCSATENNYRKCRWEEGPGTFWLRKLEYQKSRVRSKVEYIFHIIKNVFKFRKTRYRGLAKLKTLMDMLCASANFFMLAMAMKEEKARNSQTALLFGA